METFFLTSVPSTDWVLVHFKRVWSQHWSLCGDFKCKSHKTPYNHPNELEPSSSKGLSWSFREAATQEGEHWLFNLPLRQASLFPCHLYVTQMSGVSTQSNLASPSTRGQERTMIGHCVGPTSILPEISWPAFCMVISMVWLRITVHVPCREKRVKLDFQALLDL